MAPDVTRRVARIARSQAGAISRGQALAAGVAVSTITRLVQQHVWIVIHRGVYAVASSADTWRRRVFAALLAAGDSAVLAGTAAAYEWELIDRPPAVIDVAVPERSRARPRAVRIRCLSFDRDDTTHRGGIPIMTVARTLVDLAATFDDVALEDVTVDAVRRWPRTLGRLSACLDRLPNARGSSRLRRFTRLLDPEVVRELMSKFESRVLAMFLRSDIPTPRVNRMLFDPTGGLVAKLEFSWVGGRVVMECDGLRFHTTPSQKSYDDRRQNGLVLEGRVVLRYGWRDLDDPGRVVADVRRALDLASVLARAVGAREAEAT